MILDRILSIVDIQFLKKFGKWLFNFFFGMDTFFLGLF